MVCALWQFWIKGSCSPPSRICEKQELTIWTPQRQSHCLIFFLISCAWVTHHCFFIYIIIFCWKLDMLINILQQAWTLKLPTIFVVSCLLTWLSEFNEVDCPQCAVINVAPWAETLATGIVPDTEMTVVLVIPDSPLSVWWVCLYCLVFSS